MSVLAPTLERKHEDDKDAYSSDVRQTNIVDELHDNQINPVKREGQSSLFLQAPLHGPIRPLSPDTISNLSIDEYEHFRPTQRAPAHVPQAPGFRGKLAASWKRNKGLGYMLLAQVFGCLMNVTIRLLEVEGNHGKGMHPFHILFARMLITMSLGTGYMWWKKVPDFPFGAPEVRWLLVVRGFGGFFGVFGMYYSLLYLPLADATVITFLAPSLACWACSILIKEPFTRIEQLGGLVSLVGVVLIARPTSLFSFAGDTTLASGTDDAVPVTNGTTSGSNAADYENVTPQQRMAAVGVSLLGVLGAAIAYTTIRWIGKRTYPLISVNYFATWCTIVSFMAQIVLPGVGFLLPATFKDWAYLIFLGICGFIMQVLLVLGLSYEKSSRSTNMTYTQMLFALTFDKLVFGHTPGWISIIGSSLILGSAIVVAIQKDAVSSKSTLASSARVADEESQQGLLSDDPRDQEAVVNDTQMPVQEIQLRVLR